MSHHERTHVAVVAQSSVGVAQCEAKGGVCARVRLPLTLCTQQHMSLSCPCIMLCATRLAVGVPAGCKCNASGF
jgi:hypothetical protein